MFHYALRRIVIGLVTLLGITMICFLVISLMPGDPVAAKTDAMDVKGINPALIEKLRAHFELDKPLHVRYLRWLGRIVRGDFGTSFQDGRPVSDKIIDRLPATMSLQALSVLIGLSLAIPLGLFQAAKQNGWFDRISGGVFYALYAVPSYVGAIVLIYYVGVRWDLLPFRGMTSDHFETLSLGAKAKDLLAHYALITFAVTYQSIAFDSRFIRANMLEVMRQDYVRTARAKGLAERTVVMKHAFRNTFIPVLTRFAGIIPALVSGSVILEVIFNWPGLGRLFYDGVAARDYPVMMASLLINSVLVLLAFLLCDLAYALVDPRIKYD